MYQHITIKRHNSFHGSVSSFVPVIVIVRVLQVSSRVRAGTDTRNHFRIPCGFLSVLKRTHILIRPYSSVGAAQKSIKVIGPKGRVAKHLFLRQVLVRVRTLLPTRGMFSGSHSPVEGPVRAEIVPIARHGTRTIGRRETFFGLGRLLT